MALRFCDLRIFEFRQPSESQNLRPAELQHRRIAEWHHRRIAEPRSGRIAKISESQNQGGGPKGPNGGGPKGGRRGETRKSGGWWWRGEGWEVRRVGGPKCRVFSFFPPQISFFHLSLGSPRGSVAAVQGHTSTQSARLGAAGVIL